MKNYYEVLGLQNSASADEIRRAYRILARRYHPDVNPGKASIDRFRAIAEAYEILSNPDKRQKFDAEASDHIRNQAHHAYQSAQRRANASRRQSAQERHAQAQSTSSQTRVRSTEVNSPASAVDHLFGAAKRMFNQAFAGATSLSDDSQTSFEPQVKSVSILEVSISMRDAIQGVRRSVEVADGKRMRKVSVVIPPGTRPGSILRLRDRSSGEELVFVIRVANDQLLSIENKGLVMQIPITVNEAIFGASITVPTLEDPVVVRIPAGVQSGSELRLKGKGIALRDGSRADLFLRLLVHVPDKKGSLDQVKERIAELDQLYESPVRCNLPKSILS